MEQPEIITFKDGGRIEVAASVEVAEVRLVDEYGESTVVAIDRNELIEIADALRRLTE